MKFYFYRQNGEQLGPFSYEELKAKRLLKTTYVWTEGMEGWKEANELEELKDILVSEPPPFFDEKKSTNETQPTHISEPNRETDQKHSASKNEYIDIENLKYDQTYTKPIDATFVGVGLLIISNYILFSGATADIEPAVVALINLIYRILITIWVVSLAKVQNRNQIGWGIFAFILPTLSLIIIGLLRKKIKTVNLDRFINNKQKIEYCINKAAECLSKENTFDSLAYINAAIKMDENNIQVRELRGKILFQLKNLEAASDDFLFVLRGNTNADMANLYLGKIELQNKNSEKALEYWLRINEESNSYPEIRKLIDMYHTYTGTYLLEKSSALKKVPESFFLVRGWHVLRNVIYLGGLDEIDSKYGITNLVATLHIYNHGLYFEIEEGTEGLNVVIAYYEIESIILNEEENEFHMALIDRQTVSFQYRGPLPLTDTLKEISKVYEISTGRSLSDE